MKIKLHIRSISLLLAIIILFTFAACDFKDNLPSEAPTLIIPNLPNPNENIIYEDAFYEDLCYEDILVETISYETYIEELYDVEQTITELLLAENTIDEVLHQQVIYVPQQHLQDFANNSQTAQLFGDDIDVGAVIAKVTIGAGVIISLTVCSVVGLKAPVATVTVTAAAMGSAVGAGIGAAVGGAYGGVTGALNEVDSTGRNSAAWGVAVALAGLVIATVSFVAAIPSGGVSGIGALEGAHLVFAGLGLMGAVADTTINAVNCVKTFKSTNASDIDWKNVDWNSVGVSAAEQAINGASNGLLAGAFVGTITGGVYGYLDYKIPSSVYSGTKKIGTINELNEFVDAKSGRAIGTVVRSQDADGNPIFYVKEYVDPNSVKVVGDAPNGRLSKLNKKSVYGQLDKDGNVNSNWLKDFETARKRGIKLAWEQERALVARTGRGTRDWTAAEIEELLTTGKVSGYEGHHINSALFSPELADNPSNIVFYNKTEHLQIGHGGNYQNVTFGELIYRN